MLKRIKIQGYKSLADVEVHLGHLAVLIGPNASGKSNFLDALQLLSRIATCRTLREAFAPPHAGMMPPLDGTERVADLANEMDLQRVAQMDRSIDRLLRALQRQFRIWQQTED